MKQLTKAEEQIMLVLWRIKEGFLKDILENIDAPVPHSNTVATMLKILIEKGFVDFELKGRNNLYKPKVSKEKYGQKTVTAMVKGYFEGSPAKLVSHFVSENELSVKDLEELLATIRSQKKTKK
jgi:BlaI family penicillinase repressor